MKPYMVPPHSFTEVIERPSHHCIAIDVRVVVTENRGWGGRRRGKCLSEAILSNIAGPRCRQE